MDTVFKTYLYVLNDICVGGRKKGYRMNNLSGFLSFHGHTLYCVPLCHSKTHPLSLRLILCSAPGDMR